MSSTPGTPAPGLDTRERRTAHNQLHSPLLRLHAELRNKVYYFVFDGIIAVIKPNKIEDFTICCDPNFGLTGRSLPAVHSLHLATVCRQTRFETRSLF
ncbi:hypothetical protein NX059_008886 [Plenodomus lindquistii]|nr:hypothetical protein NX059_008886 [Plenodomus lindquistii]